VAALRERLADAAADALAAAERAEAGRGGAAGDAELLAVSDGRLQVRERAAGLGHFGRGRTPAMWCSVSGACVWAWRQACAVCVLRLPSSLRMIWQTRKPSSLFAHAVVRDAMPAFAPHA